MLANVGGMVVDMMTTQYMCSMLHILKPIVVDIITTCQHVFYIASAYNISRSCYSFVTEHSGKSSCNYVLCYMVEQQNNFLDILVDVLAMVVDVMRTQL